MAQRDAQELAQMKNVRLVIGSARRSEVVSLYERACAGSEPVIAVATQRTMLLLLLLLLSRFSCV